MKIGGVIESLEYLISEDCTDTQHDYADEIEYAINFMKMFNQYVDGQPTANEWIPVSEEPKEERTEVLAVLEHCDSKTIKIEVIEWSYDEWKVNWNWNILAWMPIPTYKGE